MSDWAFYVLVVLATFVILMIGICVNGPCSDGEAPEEELPQRQTRTRTLIALERQNEKLQRQNMELMQKSAMKGNLLNK